MPWNSSFWEWSTEGPDTSCSTQVSSPFCCQHQSTSCSTSWPWWHLPIMLGHACQWWWGGWWAGWCCCRDSRKLNHFFSKLLPEGLLCEWLRPGGVTPPLVQLLVEKEAVHHGNVHKMVKKGLVPFHRFVTNAVVSNQSAGHIHTAHASVVVHHSVRNGNILSLPHTTLFHVPLAWTQTLMAVIQKPFHYRLPHCENKCGKNKLINSLACTLKNVT